MYSFHIGKHARLTSKSVAYVCEGDEGWRGNSESEETFDVVLIVRSLVEHIYCKGQMLREREGRRAGGEQGESRGRAGGEQGESRGRAGESRGRAGGEQGESRGRAGGEHGESRGRAGGEQGESRGRAGGEQGEEDKEENARILYIEWSLACYRYGDMHVIIVARVRRNLHRVRRWSHELDVPYNLGPNGVVEKIPEFPELEDPWVCCRERSRR